MITNHGLFGPAPIVSAFRPTDVYGLENGGGGGSGQSARPENGKSALANQPIAIVKLAIFNLRKPDVIWQ
jgi:hypothetical protein